MKFRLWFVLVVFLFVSSIEFNSLIGPVMSRWLKFYWIFLDFFVVEHNGWFGEAVTAATVAEQSWFVAETSSGITVEKGRSWNSTKTQKEPKESITGFYCFFFLIYALLSHPISLICLSATVIYILLYLTNCFLSITIIHQKMNHKNWIIFH